MSDIVAGRATPIPGPACALGSLLDVPVPDLARGEGLPLPWHWIYLLDRPAEADLSMDGHPVHGTVPSPQRPGLRRMWAGGHVHASGTLRCEEPATRRSSAGQAGRFRSAHLRHGAPPAFAARQRLDRRDTMVADHPGTAEAVLVPKAENPRLPGSLSGQLPEPTGLVLTCAKQT
jgi:hypothetical protein